MTSIVKKQTKKIPFHKIFSEIEKVGIDVNLVISFYYTQSSTSCLLHQHNTNSAPLWRTAELPLKTQQWCVTSHKLLSIKTILTWCNSDNKLSVPSAEVWLWETSTFSLSSAESHFVTSFGVGDHTTGSVKVHKGMLAVPLSKPTFITKLKITKSNILSGKMIA